MLSKASDTTRNPEMRKELRWVDAGLRVTGPVVENLYILVARDRLRDLALRGAAARYVSVELGGLAAGDGEALPDALLGGKMFREKDDLT